ncbi:hypothetical protein CFP56_002355 [Quercus suber]|uniref:Uncharacterized protein n=1 Tax=Quercus suber TaxID=58331 RepID=A0AAW0IKW9_QUESU
MYPFTCLAPVFSFLFSFTPYKPPILKQRKPYSLGVETYSVVKKLYHSQHVIGCWASVERVNNPSESAKTTQSRKKWWKNLSKHLKYRDNWVEENRSYIMVVATPLGGVWSQSGNVTFYTSHNIKVDAGTSNYLLDYFYFIIFNAISFSGSVDVTFLLISGFQSRIRFVSVS